MLPKRATPRMALARKFKDISLIDMGSARKGHSSEAGRIAGCANKPVAKLGRETLTFATEFCDRNFHDFSVPEILSRKSGLARQGYEVTRLYSVA